MQFRAQEAADCDRESVHNRLIVIEDIDCTLHLVKRGKQGGGREQAHEYNKLVFILSSFPPLI